MDGWNTFSFLFGARPIFRGNSLFSWIVVVSNEKKAPWTDVAERQTLGEDEAVFRFFLWNQTTTYTSNEKNLVV